MIFALVSWLFNNATCTAVLNESQHNIHISPDFCEFHINFFPVNIKNEIFV